MPPDRPLLKFFDLAVPFFLPVWRRIVTVVAPVLWAMVEFANAQTVWGVMFLCFGGIAAWQFLTADWDAVAAEAARDP